MLYPEDYNICVIYVLLLQNECVYVSSLDMFGEYMTCIHTLSIIERVCVEYPSCLLSSKHWRPNFFFGSFLLSVDI